MITAISPIDGRYSSKTKHLEELSSEYALIKYRIKVEIEWLIHLSKNLPDLKPFSDLESENLRLIYSDFTPLNAEEVKKIESTTNHDVKAVEYYIKNYINTNNTISNSYFEYIHFVCTSEDINNLSYALMLRDITYGILLADAEAISLKLWELAELYKALPMLSRTHGQTATPTTLGKEIANTAYRLDRKIKQLDKQEFLGKMNGAVGNFNAHLSAYKSENWLGISQDFIEDVLDLTFNPFTTQIEPHDFIAELAHKTVEINTILIDFNRDIWGYISLGYFKQQLKAGEVGSSTMPHKVNPIDFENSEGNLGVANSLLSHLAEKLPISRWQRDLTDSTVLRNVGSAFAYCTLAYQSLLKGVSKLEINKVKLNDDLENAWEVLAEPIQTVMRRYKISNPYEKLKELTRGQTINANILHAFIDSLDELPIAVRSELKQLTPQNYIGLAEQIVNLKAYRLNRE